MHEGGIKSPFLARWPGKIEAGSRSDLLNGFHDFLPTIAEIVDAPVLEENTGLSYLPTLFGQEGQKTHDYLYIEFTKGREQVLDSKALRFGKWKVFQNVAKKKPLELYDLEADPTEQNNLAKNKHHQEILQKAKD